MDKSIWGTILLLLATVGCGQRGLLWFPSYGGPSMVQVVITLGVFSLILHYTVAII